MSDEPTNPEPEKIERSVDPETVFHGMTATGILTGGIGTLALGVSKLKETFGGERSAEEPEPVKGPANE